MSRKVVEGGVGLDQFEVLSRHKTVVSGKKKKKSNKRERCRKRAVRKLMLEREKA
jgi:hypothetical protein